MARGTTLTNLLAMLNAELGNSTASDTTRDARYSILLSNKQKWYSTEYEWSFLERRWDCVVPAGQQFTALPTLDDLGDNSAINFERMPRVEVLWTIKYQPVHYGIGAEEYNTYNFQLNGQASDPIQRWRMASNVNEASSPDKFEVWPVPVSVATMRFTAQRTLKALAVGADTADLDDMLLVLSVAGELLTRTKQADAQYKLAEAKNRFQWLKQNYPAQDKKRQMGGGGDAEFKRQRRNVGLIIATH